MILISVNTFNMNNKESYEKHQKQPQQPSSTTLNLFGQYFADFESSRSNLFDY